MQEIEWYIALHVYSIIRYTPSVPNYKTLSTNSHPLRKIVNLVNHAKSINNLYYHSKIILLLSLYSLNCLSLMFGERIIKQEYAGEKNN